jgi:hypothetical protein
MGRAYTTHHIDDRCPQNIFGDSDENRQLGGCIHIRENDVKMYLKEKR